MSGRTTGAGLLLAAMAATGAGAVPADAGATAPPRDAATAGAGSPADGRPVMWTVPPPRRSGG